MLSYPKNEAKRGANNRTANLAFTFKTLKWVVSANLHVKEAEGGWRAKLLVGKLKEVGLPSYTPGS